MSNYARAGPGMMLLETAGGVHSPTPTGTSQADLYRPLRLPIILVGDHRLGGISSSISAFESLHMRGYDVDSVMLFEDDRYKNDEYLSAFFARKGIPLLSLPPPPERNHIIDDDERAMAAYYDDVSKLEVVHELVSSSSMRHTTRIERLQSMASRAHTNIWYPFTQHRDVSSATIMTIDSAYGDFFQTYNPSASEMPVDTAKPADCNESETLSTLPLVRPTFDGSASWWTQGVGHANPALSLSAAYAAGRYGHVMFAGAIHEPAISLAELLLQNLDNPKLQKVFYSDNGSTGMEVAIKMGLRATCVRYGWDAPREDVGILGLKGSYHGDTIGAMDCSEPSTFNQNVEWYRGRGYWFDYPTVKMTGGAWVVESPPGLEDELGPRTAFSSLGEVFNLESRERGASGDRYRRYIKSVLERLVWDEGKRFGALMMEPLILGAGGMIFVCV